jgi:hypothetical protein
MIDYWTCGFCKHTTPLSHGVFGCPYMDRINFLNHKNGGLEYPKYMLDEQSEITNEQWKYMTNKTQPLFPTKSTRTIWISKDGRQTEISKLPVAHLRNIYELLWNEAWKITDSKNSFDLGDIHYNTLISKYTDENYPGRYELDHNKRTEKFLYEFCLSWPALFLRCKTEGICKPNGEIIKWVEKYSYNDFITGKLPYDLETRKHKILTDSDGKQYVLFEVE